MTPTHVRRTLLFILLIALLARLLALWGARDAEPLLDERAYLYRAHALVDGHGFVGTFRSSRFQEYSPEAVANDELGAYQPPAYPAFLAGSMWLMGRDLPLLKLPQVLVSVLVVLLVYLLGRDWFGRSVGLVAAAIAALYPNLIAFSHLLWAETLYLSLFLTAIWLLTRSRRPPGVAAVLVAGVLLGMAALSRSASVYFLPVLGTWLIFHYRGKPARTAALALLLMITTGATILPWTLRNWRVYGAFVLIDTSGPYTLWRGNTPNAYPDLGRRRYMFDWPFQRLPVLPVAGQAKNSLIRQAEAELAGEPSDPEIAAYALRSTFGSIRDRPDLFVKRAGYKLVGMWNPTSFLIRHFVFGGYGEVAPIARSTVTWAAILSYLAVMILALAAIFRSLRDERVLLVVLLMLFHSALTVAAFGLTRFRMPVMPFLIVLGALSLHSVWRRLASRRTGSSRQIRPPSPAPSSGLA